MKNCIFVLVVLWWVIGIQLSRLAVCDPMPLLPLSFIWFVCGWQEWRMASRLLPPLNRIWAVMIVWRIRGKIIRTVLCCIVWHNYCAQSYAQWYEQFLQMSCFGIRSSYIFVFLLGQFTCVRVNYFVFCLFPVCCCLIVSTSAINCLENSCPKWPIKCQVGC